VVDNRIILIGSARISLRSDQMIVRCLAWGNFVVSAACADISVLSAIDGKVEISLISAVTAILNLYMFAQLTDTKWLRIL